MNASAFILIVQQNITSYVDINRIVYLLSIPSNPEAVTRPRADLPKLSLRAALAATAAKFWLDAAPPMDNITFR
jgi:hypothetical protein